MWFTRRQRECKFGVKTLTHIPSVGRKGVLIKGPLKCGDVSKCKRGRGAEQPSPVLLCYIIEKGPNSNTALLLSDVGDNLIRNKQEEERILPTVLLCDRRALCIYPFPTVGRTY